MTSCIAWFRYPTFSLENADALLFCYVLYSKVSSSSFNGSARQLIVVNCYAEGIVMLKALFISLEDSMRQLVVVPDVLILA